MKVLSGQVALITGSSRGIGKAIALDLARQGAAIAVNYVRREDEARKTQKELESLGVKSLIYQANVGDSGDIENLVANVLKDFGKINILVHNAALGAFKPVTQLRMNQWDLSFDINTKALLLLTQKVIPSMRSEKGGSIVAISSLGAHRVIPNYGAIGISKSALESLIRYLAVELAPQGIRVNAVSGGLVETDAVKLFPNFAQFKQEAIKRTPAGRIGRPDDLAKVVGFLVSPEAGWICGQTILADGGLSLI